MCFLNFRGGRISNLVYIAYDVILLIFGPPSPAVGTYDFASVRSYFSVRRFQNPFIGFSDYLHKVVA